jgi:hypothetical protein
VLGGNAIQTYLSNAIELCPIKICWWHRVSVYNGYVGGMVVLWCGRNLVQQMISRGHIVK